VFRIHDSATGQARPVHPARPGELRIWVAGQLDSDATGPAGLRACLVADLVRRVAERHHLRVSAWHQAPGDSAEPALRAAWDALNIYPAELAASPPEPLDVAVAQDGQPGGSPAYRMEPGEVRPPALDITGLDPLALRLALLGHRYREPAILPGEVLAAADQTLRRWREQVAGWARSPSRPVAARYTSDVLGALDDDLDGPAAVRSLRALAADAELPPGAKFEAFAYLDQLLGLDLAREVGR
jgi:cysteinyl-tRNA synthetase